MVLQLLHPHHVTHSFLPAVKSFPSNAPTSFNLADLKHWVAASDPLHPALLACVGWTTLVWVLSEITGNVSQVDRLWTTIPTFFSAYFTFYPYLTGLVDSVYDLDRRMLLVFALQLCWSARLTYQSARRGFLNPNSEDYRWPLVRNWMNPLAFKVFNLVFIAIYQNILLLVAELPQYLLLTHWLAGSKHVSALARLKPHHKATTHQELNVADVVLAVLFVGTLMYEMRADNQQQRFQRTKKAALSKQQHNKPLDKLEQKALERGFVAEGLWSWSRHPNFAAEQLTWYLLYAFTVLPFLPLSQSITSHPLSTLANLFSPATAVKHLPTVLSSSKSLLFRLSSATPSLDTSLRALEHPLASLRTLVSNPSAFLASAPKLSTVKVVVRATARQALKEIKADEGVYWNYSILAPLSMSALFAASTELTERITGSKYPLYKAYRHRVARFLPFWTPIKGLWLFVTGRRGKVDRRIWGEDGAGGGKGKLAKGKGKGKRE